MVSIATGYIYKVSYSHTVTDQSIYYDKMTKTNKTAFLQKQAYSKKTTEIEVCKTFAQAYVRNARQDRASERH